LSPSAAYSACCHSEFASRVRHELCLKPSLIWLTHIGMDRAVGNGLKYPTGFKDTHLQRV
jgi:hypothetical protein